MDDEQDELLRPAGGLELLDPEVASDLSTVSTWTENAIYFRFMLAVMGGIPWVGSVISALGNLSAERDQSRVNEFHKRWVEGHERKLEELARTVKWLRDQISKGGPEAEARMADESYLALVGQGFRTWDSSSTTDKRRMVAQALANAGTVRICTDDVVRMFLEWIDRYHESHFAVVRVVFKWPGSTRQDIWDHIHGGKHRDDSAEADLFRLLVHDLSTGRVLRQQRPTDGMGNFLKKPTGMSKGRRSPTMKSAFDDVEPYELTELGKQFVLYSMKEVVPRIGHARDTAV